MEELKTTITVVQNQSSGQWFLKISLYKETPFYYVETEDVCFIPIDKPWAEQIIKKLNMSARKRCTWGTWFVDYRQPKFSQ
jgi:hypothetical protein